MESDTSSLLSALSLNDNNETTSSTPSLEVLSPSLHDHQRRFRMSVALATLTCYLIHRV